MAATFVDRYRLLRALGSGGEGTVYEAADASLARRVAIKLMPSDRADGAGLLALLREVQHRQRRHPNVVFLEHAGRYPGGVFLVMELVKGRSLESLLGDGPLPWQDATALLAAACDGTKALHDSGILHRDIKPANLLRARDGALKLTDFGLARRVASTPATGGTLHYMSPEQCLAESLDERTDIYSLGATYHALLTGCPPYAETSPLHVMFEHCSAPGPDPRKHRPAIPAACAAIVMRAMAKRRADRYDSARDLQTALRAFLRIIT